MKLSILIPSRNEPHLARTLLDIKQHMETDLEVLWMEDDGRGQRACTNELARQARCRYVMKTDAHCSFSQGFDRLLLEEMDDKTILAPLLMPLEPMTWSVNGKKQMAQFVFDTNFVMHHADGVAGDTMCLQGSAWMVSRANYWDWHLGDETLGSWGNQGVQLGVAAWLNGGICRTTDKAYYGHLFRNKSEDFPYERGLNPGEHANKEMRKRHFNQSIAGLVRKSNYPADWTEENVMALPSV
jgi:hypothetical protein